MIWDDFCDISKERLLTIERGAIFKRLDGYKMERFTGCRLRKEVAPSGRIIAVTYRENEGVMEPYMYVAELDKNKPVLSGIIVDDFSIHMDSGALTFWGDLRYER